MGEMSLNRLIWQQAGQADPHPSCGAAAAVGTGDPGAGGIRYPAVGSLVAVGLMAAGYLLWALTEYWVHRAVFHFGSFGDAPALSSRPTRIADPLAAL